MLLVLPAMMLMTGCGMGSSKFVYVSPCPPLTGYTKDYQAKVWTEKVAAEKDNAAWPRMIDDYGRLRATLRGICDNV